MIDYVFRFYVAAFAFACVQTYALAWESSPVIAPLFEEAGVDGTFVLFDVTAGRLVGHDKVRAHTRFIPASTFKIPNTLIGLSTRAVENVDEILPYGGKPLPFPQWEKDMNLREAIVISNVPIYQELARRIGSERMAEEVRRLDYGNTRIGSVIDQFWLKGPLKISAVEQAQFLARLAKKKLALPREHQEIVREIIQVEQGSAFTLHAKTGWQNASPPPGIGWWVGWVEKGERIYTFALNIDIQQAADADKRIPLARAILRALEVLP